MNLVAFTGLTAITFDEPDIFHQYETLMVIFSGAALSLSGIFHYISKKIDCHDTGCVHGSCEPKKKVSFKLFYVSLALFLINLIFYLAH
ncbi:MAG: hypothetical protein COV36_01185 [Alphaproteobacteria bacterium CG11_big_fil_rev_8_21_14_0_20_44_7]|nr:MAG: hypothetical protein COV36_01185 [Alphaproteobacteria bacterium CG11_big_fil_rev_8_21_14_0_20_44_7]